MKRRASRLAQDAPQERMRLVRVRVGDVYGGVFARQEDMALASLAASIARHGLLQPVIVRPCAQAGHYALVCGGRRLAACRLLGMKEIDALVLPMDACAAAAAALEEEMTHVSPSAMETAQAIHSGGEAMQKRFSLDERVIAQHLALLALPQMARRVVAERRLSLGQALPLLDVADEALQLEAALIIAERGLSSAQAQRLVHGPQRAADEQILPRRRAVHQALEAASRMAGLLRAQGVDVCVRMHAQNGELYIQLVFAREQKEDAGRNPDERSEN